MCAMSSACSPTVLQYCFVHVQMSGTRDLPDLELGLIDPPVTLASAIKKCPRCLHACHRRGIYLYTHIYIYDNDDGGGDHDGDYDDDDGDDDDDGGYGGDDDDGDYDGGNGDDDDYGDDGDDSDGDGDGAVGPNGVSCVYSIYVSNPRENSQWCRF